MHRVPNRGMSLIEVVIGSTIIVTGIVALSSTFAYYVKFALGNENNIQASYLAEEGLEAVTFLRELSWATNIQPLSTTTPYYLAWDSTTSLWKATTTPQYVDGKFLRQITIADVKRDVNDKIATVGTYDPHTKQIFVSVQYYQGHATSTQSLSTYITNLKSN